MLTCREMTELCTEFEEGTLSWADWMQFRMHLMMCGACREYVRQMKLTSELLGQRPVDALPQETRTELADMFRTWHAERDDEG